MEKSTQLGGNRTGIDMSPLDSRKMADGASELTPASGTDYKLLRAIERDYIQNAGPVGSVPIPGTLRGAMKSSMDKLTGRNPEVLLNKIGERLAYERSGTRLYESFIRRCEALNGERGSQLLPLDALQEIRDEEAEHFRILRDVMHEMGADPTAQTPDADVSGTIALGIQKVLNDPRSSISQCLEALLSVELADNAAWELLIELADDFGLDDVSERFRHALRQEETHVDRVRGWYRNTLLEQAGAGKQTQH